MTPGFPEIQHVGVLPPFLTAALQAEADRVEHEVEPTKRIGVPPLLDRWRLFSFGDVEVNLHRFHQSDDDRAKHDHPWESLSVCLREGAIDVAQDGSRYRVQVGDVLYRSAAYAHWIEVEPGYAPLTLFITGPRVREWGFLCPGGWKHWRDFTAPANGVESGAVGAGCDG